MMCASPYAFLDVDADERDAIDRGVAASLISRTAGVLALTTFDDDEEEEVFAALRAGAVGYPLEDASRSWLLERRSHSDRDRWA